MTVPELLEEIHAEASSFQRLINSFVDDFRRASREEQCTMVADGPQQSGTMEGLVAAVASSLCREAGIAAPGWVRSVRSPEPFFPMPARGYALRVRLMLESPPPFRTRNVFVPENYLSRA